MVPFFNRIAHDKGFHPTRDLSRWYDITYNDVLSYKVVNRALFSD